MPLSIPGIARCTALVIGLVSPLSLQAKDDRTILVTGEGESGVAPDQVEFNVGIDVTEAKVETAKAKSNEAMRRILAVTKEFKIDAKDVQSDYMRVQPIQDAPYNPNGKPARPVISYNARRDIRILLRDINKYEGLMAAIFNSGANNLHNLQFKSSTQTKLEGEARLLALKDAKAKAEAMAQQMGLKLGRPRSIAEGLRDPGPSPKMAMMMESASRSSSEPTLAPGEVRVKQQVTVIFDAE
ncbi:MAG TPA: SIMPL domain-containing protein [Oligoflexus sp.]|uniref:SIMPL domain-containing protein n=1 Tax=Oligoflexus sp. TaxID=1971216 RepID=UPI002D5020B2|nr:SIMPL domain-containing protein [Oligoflexus sp.]HYX31948.1 SIMPL domain-containing protein [Oligoflexus sp.]